MEPWTSGRSSDRTEVRGSIWSLGLPSSALMPWTSEVPFPNGSHSLPAGFRVPAASGGSEFWKMAPFRDADGFGDFCSSQVGNSASQLPSAGQNSEKVRACMDSDDFCVGGF